MALTQKGRTIRPLAEPARRTQPMVWPRYGPLVAVVLSLVILLPVWWWGSTKIEERLLAERRAQLTAELTPYANALSTSLNRRLLLADGLRAFAQAQIDSPNDLVTAEFETFAAGLRAGADGVRNIALSPGNVTQYIFPREGNEAVLGYNPLEDARRDVRLDAQRAIDTRRLVVSGPNQLIQGGLGLIGRYAVYQGDRYWGLASVVLDVSPLLREAGLTNPPSSFDLGLRNDLGDVYLGDALLFQTDPVVARIELPEGYWQVGAVPRGGWAASIQDQLRLYQQNGLLIIGLVVVLIYVSMTRQATLVRAVAQRTRELTAANLALADDVEERTRTEQALRESEERFRRIADNAPVMLFVTGPDGGINFFNRSGLEFTGLTMEEAQGSGWQSRVHPDDVGHCQETITDSLAEPHAVTFEIRMRRADGEYRWVAVTSLPRSTPEGEFLGYVGASVDITEQVEARRSLEDRVDERTREVELRTRSLETLYRADEELYRSLRLDDVLEALVDVAAQVLKADKSVIHVWDREREQLVATITRGIAPDTLPLMAHKLGEGVIGTVALLRESIALEDVAAEAERVRRAEDREGIKSFLTVPIVIADELFGVFTVGYTQHRTFDADDDRLLNALAQRAALAIENARLYEQAQQAAVLEERQRLARDLHDAVTQTLFSASLIAEVVPRLWSRNEEEGKRRLEELRQLTRGALAEMRTLLLELRPEALVDVAFGDLLRQLAEAFIGRSRLPIDVTIEGERTFTPDVQIALYRIAQEALNNVAKHANATRVQLSLHCLPDHVELRIRDDGRGFDPASTPPGHLGMGTMRERAQAIGAQLTVQSAPGAGTEVTVVWAEPGLLPQPSTNGTGSTLTSSIPLPTPAPTEPAPTTPAPTRMGGVHEPGRPFARNEHTALGAPAAPRHDPANHEYHRT